jgi:hypothetical protein
LIDQEFRLRALEPTFWAFIWPSELSAFQTSPDDDLSAVWARELCGLCTGSDHPVARRAHGHGEAPSFTQHLHLSRDCIVTENLHIYAILRSTGFRLDRFRFLLLVHLQRRRRSHSSVFPLKVAKAPRNDGTILRISFLFSSFRRTPVWKSMSPSSESRS